jgi:uridine kinase
MRKFVVVSMLLCVAFSFAWAKDLKDIGSLAELIATNLSKTEKKALLIGISGASGSGKTYLAKRIAKDFNIEDVLIINEDFYYKDQAHLALSERVRTNYDHPDSMDHKLLIEHLQKLSRGESVNIPTYDYKNHTRSSKIIRAKATPVIILEGILLLTNSELRELMDIKIFVETPLDMCILRRMSRDVKERGRSLESVMAQYRDTVRPMYFQFIEPTKQFADVIVPGLIDNQIATDLVQTKIAQLLSKK